MAAHFLRNIRAKRVALVDEGANFDPKTGDGAHVMLWKHAEGKPPQEKKVDKNFVSNLMKFFKDAGMPVPEGAAGAADCDVEKMKAHHELLGKMIADHGDGPHPEGHPVHALKAAHEVIGKALAGKEGTDQIHKEGDMDESMVKAAVAKATTDLEKRVKDSEARNAELEKSVAKERDTRLDGEMCQILKSFKNTAFNVDLADEKNDVVKFRKMKQDNPEAYERTIELLKSQDAQISKGADLNRSVGSSRSGGNDNAWDQIVAKANEKVSKSSSKMTMEKAIEEAMMENPELVKRYRAGAQA